VLAAAGFESLDFDSEDFDSLVFDSLDFDSPEEDSDLDSVFDSAFGSLDEDVLAPPLA